jgi:hypothetical protein
MNDKTLLTVSLQQSFSNYFEAVSRELGLDYIDFHNLEERVMEDLVI